VFGVPAASSWRIFREAKVAEKGTCIVAGGASGIGFAAAQELVSQGWRVGLLDIQAEKLEAAQQTLGSESHALQADITDAAAVAKAIAEIERALGPVTAAVNSAGIARDIPCLETDPALFRAILDVNVTGSFIVAQAAARAMIEGNRKGAIVNIASVSGIRGNTGRVAYGASKGAVVVMTKVMAIELAAHGIRVNAVSPGPVDTPLVQALHGEDIRRLWLKVIPQRRYAAPSEIASVIAFLLDDKKSSFITGQNWAADGGFEGGGLLPEG
jgi:NAD(P)-dependent dehydrogenase (short-subunit alcohol dehydrogenase family)